MKAVAAPGRAIAADLLLVERSISRRSQLHRPLTSNGFAVTAVAGAKESDAVCAETGFGFAVTSTRLADDPGFALVRRLRWFNPAMRIVVVTDVDSFASCVLALRAGADDYIAHPVRDHELVDALLDRAPVLPPVPDMPLGLSRTCWEHVIRIYEQCDRNVSHAARRLGMHRRSLQRMLGKRAPPLRASTCR